MTQTLAQDLEPSSHHVEPLLLRTGPALQMNDHQFYEFCQQNTDLRIERDKHGDLIIMAPTGGWAGSGNAELTADFVIWARADGTGRVFNSDTDFRLPDKAVRAPDVSWIRHERFDALSRVEGKEFPPLCPDFVLELRSVTDRVSVLQEKMQEYLANGARLGWLINPNRREVFIYRPGKEVEHLINPTELSGEDVLPGFRLQLTVLWRALGLS